MNFFETKIPYSKKNVVVLVSRVGTWRKSQTTQIGTPRLDVQVSERASQKVVALSIIHHEFKHPTTLSCQRCA